MVAPAARPLFTTPKEIGVVSIIPLVFEGSIKGQGSVFTGQGEKKSQKMREMPQDATRERLKAKYM